jgi:hypothetical protein
MIVGLMPLWSTPIRGIGRIGGAIGREIAAALRLEADLSSHVSPQDVARRHIRGELGRDAPEAEPGSSGLDRVPGWIVLMVVGAIVITVVVLGIWL